MSEEGKQNKIRLNEDDLFHLFELKKNPFYKKKWFQITREILEILLLLVIVVFMSYAVVNGPTVYDRMKYFVSIDILNGDWGKDNSSLLVSASETQTTSDIGNRLIIPKIALEVPIIWNTEQNQVKEKLREGVAHLTDSSTPNESGGNVFIIGSSSDFWWRQGEYKDVFALLDKLGEGDLAGLTYNNINYVYKVTGKQVVDPQKVKITLNNEGEILTLMTSVPIGTNLNRLLVTAQLISTSKLLEESLQESGESDKSDIEDETKMQEIKFLPEL